MDHMTTPPPVPGWLKTLVVVQAVIIGILMTVFIYFTVTGKSFKKTEITSFEECAQAGGVIMESYPEQCMTKDKKSFTRKLSEEEQKKLQPPSGI
jgi:hypothetical protein